MAEAEELKRLRAVLQHELDDKAAAAVIFIGLDKTEAIPESRESWIAFVKQGLRQALQERVSAAEADRLVTMLKDVVSGITQAPPPPEARRSSSGFPTRELPKLQGPSKVLVVAGGSRLARTLKVALGNRVVPMAVGEAGRVAAFIDDFEPGVLVVDMNDPIPQLGPGVAQGLDENALVVLWGANPKATRLAETLQRQGIRATVFDRSEGVAGLVELVHGAAT